MFRLCLLNTRGAVVDSLETEWNFPEPGPMHWNQDLADLYHSARRVAHNVDDAIDSLLADIEKGISAPPSRPKKGLEEDPWASDVGYSDEAPF